MDQTNDDLYMPMDTETYEEKESFGRKTARFFKKFLLIIVTIALLLFLILQFILISGGSTFKDEWNAYHADSIQEAVENGANIAAEVIAVEAEIAEAVVVDTTDLPVDTTDLPVDPTDADAVAEAIIETETENIEAVIEAAA